VFKSNSNGVQEHYNVFKSQEDDFVVQSQQLCGYIGSAVLEFPNRLYEKDRTHAKNAPLMKSPIGNRRVKTPFKISLRNFNQLRESFEFIGLARIYVDQRSQRVIPFIGLGRAFVLSIHTYQTIVRYLL
jgi:hypothetical protein